MGFQKGHPSYHTEESKKKISRNNAKVWLGKKLSKEHRAKLRLSKVGYVPWNKGKKMSDEYKKNISLAQKGRISPMKGKKSSNETKEKLRQANLGKKLSEKTKNKIAESNIGKHCREKCTWWKGGVTPINMKIRKSTEYRLWREAVFKRDNYQCIWGGKEHGSNLNADHIKPFSLFPELRFAIDNGRTLCIDCHRKTDTFGARVNLKKPEEPLAAF